MTSPNMETTGTKRKPYGIYSSIEYFDVQAQSILSEKCISELSLTLMVGRGGVQKAMGNIELLAVWPPLSW